ncbi:hypothetical protein BD324DRAFT_482390 [Kockovaella imperatae]|uniref:Fumarylacetoacetase-like C-terminal domain-containing protein n=1 Tax=Kockovaella imperatae TaxID=4999 RepID=A0A1Y1UGP4_9TREE|nr:hypothetical protein BD324DRAFT_482390 [Kockovaella imperatae]ORX36235.1 hypothetical protein BD324DRAFT_482390 [Kockovaella imperatae]
MTSLFDVIERWDETDNGATLKEAEEVLNLGDVEVLAPLRGRDVLAVGYNYKDHHAEFQNTGIDKSMSGDLPEYPVIFTKRATSIVGHGHPIYTHPKVTSKVDYEGELGIIIGKGGFRILKEHAWDHVWGATIINDVTARDRQGMHKQFYIGKSLNSHCPMGPYAVHKSNLDFNNMSILTQLNGQTVQSQPTTDLLFDIPTLVETLSMGITLQPGDVIATGTPVGVGASTGRFFKGGDVISVSIEGLGTLENTVEDGDGAGKVSQVREHRSEV